MQVHLVLLIIGSWVKTIQCEEELPKLGPYNIKARIVFTTTNETTTNDNKFNIKQNLLLLQGKDTRQLIIGAPTAKNKAGVSYKCEFPNYSIISIVGERREKCNPIEFNYKGNDQKSDRKSMLLGASVAGTNSSNPLVICAPHFVRKWLKKSRTINGACYVLKYSKTNNDNTVEVIPYYKIKKEKLFANKMDNLEAGWTSHVTPDRPESVLIGAPKYQGGKGIVLYYEHAAVETPEPEEIQCDCGESLSFGYSIASGHFNVDLKNEIYLAVSAPNKTGIVLIFRLPKKPDEVSTIVGDQKKDEMFGYSLATIRRQKSRYIDTDDLAVGAPFYSSDGLYRYGKVYLFDSLSTRVGQEKPQYLKGVATIDGDKTEPGSMFGAAIVDLGDLDGDGISEIGIGAPEANNRNGAFYVYKRYKENYIVHTKCIQKIIFKGNHGFGNSLASIPFGDRPCQDVTVGALRSYDAVVLPCHLWTSTILKITPFADNVNSTHLHFVAEFHVSLVHTKWTRDFSIITDLNITVVAKYKNHKVEIKSEHGELLQEYKTSTKLEKKSEKKKKNEIANVFSFNLTFMPKEMEYNDVLTLIMKTEMGKDPSEGRTYESQFARAKPDETKETLRLGCKDHIACKPNIALTITTREPQYIRDAKMVNENGLLLMVRVHNSGEAAYDATLYVSVPDELKVNKPERCILVNKTLECKLHNPVWRNEEETIYVQFHDISKSWSSLPIMAKVSCPTCGTSEALKTAVQLSAHDLEPILTMTLELNDTQGPQEYVRGSINNKSERAMLMVARLHNSGETAYDVELLVEVPKQLILDKPKNEDCKVDTEDNKLKCKLHSPIENNKEKNVILQFHETGTDRNWTSLLVVARAGCPTCSGAALERNATLFARDLKPNLNMTLELRDRHGDKVNVVGTQNVNNLVLVVNVSNSGEEAYNSWLQVWVREPRELSINPSGGCQNQGDKVQCNMATYFLHNEKKEFKLDLKASPELVEGPAMLAGRVGYESSEAYTEQKLDLQIQRGHKLAIKMDIFHLQEKLNNSDECKINMHRDLLSNKPIFIYSYQITNKGLTPWKGLVLQFSVTGNNFLNISESLRIKEKTEALNGSEACNNGEKNDKLTSVEHLTKNCQFNLLAGEAIEVNLTLRVEPAYISKLINDGFFEIFAKAILLVPDIPITSFDTIVSDCWLKILQTDDTSQIASSTVFNVMITTLLAILFLFTFATCCILGRRSRSFRRQHSLVRTESVEGYHTSEIKFEVNKNENDVRWNGEKEDAKYSRIRRYSFINPILEQYPDDETDMEYDKMKNINKLLVDFEPDNINVDSDCDEISEHLQERVPLTPSNFAKTPKFHYY